jgi:hypothetical protein
MAGKFQIRHVRALLDQRSQRMYTTAKINNFVPWRPVLK